MKKKILLLTPLLLMICFCISAIDKEVILKQLFYGSEDIIEQAEDLISLSVDAVWFASSVTDSRTFTGTLTQSSTDANSWFYAQGPSDKLILNFANGDVIHFLISNMDGFVDGNAYDFTRSHLMDFTSVIPDKMNLRIQSDTRPDNEKINWTRIISGKTFLEDLALDVNLTVKGNNNEEIDNGFAFGDYYNEATGQIIAEGNTYTINEKYITKIGHNSNTAIYVQSREIVNNNSVSGDFGSFRFENVDCFWVGGTSFYNQANHGIYNLIIEDYNWSAVGNVYQNNQFFGSIKYDRQIINNNPGAYIIADGQDGRRYFLFPALQPALIAQSFSEPKSHNNRINIYPNPVMDQMNIEFDLNETTNLRCFVTNIQGRKILDLETAYFDKKKNIFVLNVSFFAPGIYLLHVQTNKEYNVHSFSKL